MTATGRTSAAPAMGWIGLGDQGLPMATAISEAGFPLHAWARQPASLDGLGGVPHVRHDSVKAMTAACDVVALCAGTDQDVLELAADGGLLEGLRPGSVVVNHGTGLPGNAVRAGRVVRRGRCRGPGRPGQQGLPAAQERRLTTMVGGPQPVAERCRQVFASFSRRIVHLGSAGAGQRAKLFNNALPMMNQAAIADIVDLATGLRIGPTTRAPAPPQPVRSRSRCPSARKGGPP